MWLSNQYFAVTTPPSWRFAQGEYPEEFLDLIPAGYHV